MKKILAVAALLSSFASSQSFAMCGCFLPPRPPPQTHVADSKLTNKSSKVVLVRDGDRTVLTMANDYQGDAKQFAIVVPVPTAITREQIHIGSKEPLEALAQSTSPQLLEYPPIDPCSNNMAMRGMMGGDAKAAAEAPAGHMGGGGAGALVPVKIEGSWTVGEYDIQILSATDADALVSWLKDHGYAVPDAASPLFASYLRQNMHFFLAKVNLTEQSKLGYSYLRPIQIAYQSPKFVLPIRLGMLNADGPSASQELTVWAITKKGRVESTNYRTVRVPSQQGGMLPEFVKNDFEGTYRKIFANLERREGNDVVFLEYAGSPAATIASLGVWWADSEPSFVTRLHFTYDKEHFPEDLVLQETADNSPHQPVFSVQDSLQSSSCMSVFDLRQSQRGQHDTEAQNLARLTGEDVSDIRRRIDDGSTTSTSTPPRPDATPTNNYWYQNLWK